MSRGDKLLGGSCSLKCYQSDVENLPRNSDYWTSFIIILFKYLVLAKSDAGGEWNEIASRAYLIMTGPKWTQSEFCSWDLATFSSSLVISKRSSWNFPPIGAREKSKRATNDPWSTRACFSDSSLFFYVLSGWHSFYEKSRILHNISRVLLAEDKQKKLVLRKFLNDQTVSSPPPLVD